MDLKFLFLNAVLLTQLAYSATTDQNIVECIAKELARPEYSGIFEIPEAVYRQCQDSAQTASRSTSKITPDKTTEPTKTISTTTTTEPPTSTPTTTTTEPPTTTTTEPPTTTSTTTTTEPPPQSTASNLKTTKPSKKSTASNNLTNKTIKPTKVVVTTPNTLTTLGKQSSLAKKINWVAEKLKALREALAKKKSSGSKYFTTKMIKTTKLVTSTSTTLSTQSTTTVSSKKASSFWDGLKAVGEALKDKYEKYKKYQEKKKEQEKKKLNSHWWSRTDDDEPRKSGPIHDWLDRMGGRMRFPGFG